ncbi:MAG: hypothetical protein A2096_05610 [Spirochaetes bacterium GWF1_41_5]|nr:MAG: hypothetical protein A2096_05610 [Spirochaetes bacterium GWF1_41_5]HBE04108.1 hypothetical protein [Spirochaetia bacterium]
MKQRAGIIDETGNVKMIIRELPEPGINEVRIKVKASLISPGTETSMIKSRRIKSEKNVSPFGYSVTGEIISVNSDLRFLKPGMRISAMGAGQAIHGDYVNVAVNLVRPLPDKVSFHDGLYSCLGATALQAVRRADPKLGEYGLVMGMGIIGNLVYQLGKISGSRMIGWEALPGRRKIAHSCGIKNIIDPQAVPAVEETNKFSNPYGLDFAVMAFGGDGTKAFEQARECMKLSADGHRMGRIVLVGGCPVSFTGAASSGNLDILSSARTGPGYHDSAWEHGADYPAGFVQFTTARNLDIILDLIADKQLAVSQMTTHVMALEKIGDAVDLLMESPDQAMGIVLTMD